ncbi:phosphoribosylglycinamide formyltransferase-1 [Scopulibacillus darangshiensis]|uniref:Phosphoribosylglycinamide formyltransferase n=1 Tax=Scopulibacillus darangshiensis TaxID=442528 RepID=A0A4R2NRX3_9BACL|nr:phosphoribosylglycinamide formyltransferase [Scopulibacillus darangshiensis]TCP24105.1 phosphoribosylglycinamide formyltransferase-1 [Scopulibacillus darangshiensis]
MRKLAIFASGNGSNFQALADSVQKGTLDAEIVLLVCDKKDAFVIQRAKEAGIPAFSCSPKEYENKAAYEQAILDQLHIADAEMIILAGYMRLIGPTLLSAYRGRIINIHPSLLPAFPGLNAIEQAYEKGVKVTGVTIHYVDEGVDTGPIIAQEALQIEGSEAIETLTARVHRVEHALYPKTIAALLKKSEGVT